MEALIVSFSTFISTMLGGLFGIRHRDRLHLILSFTAGVLIAIPFFEIIPEIFSIATEHKFDVTPGLIAIVIGFFAIHILERSAVIHHGFHETEYAEHKHPLVGLIGASGLVFHSFLDGVGIGLAFHVSRHVGFLVAVAVIAHDFSDGLNTVSYMLLHKNTLGRARMLLLADATTPIFGAASTYFFTIPDQVLVLYLGFFAGFLLYIGASDLLPEAHSEHSSFAMVGLTLLGALFIFVVTRFT
jgi:zinc transporter ZupT